MSETDMETLLSACAGAGEKATDVYILGFFDTILISPFQHLLDPFSLLFSCLMLDCTQLGGYYADK